MESKLSESLPIFERPNRKCGDCSECCTVLAVATLGKPTHQRCAHVRVGTRACSIYEQRPDECGRYECAWLRGMGSNSQRPDKVGLVVTPEETAFGRTFLIMESRPGAAKRGKTVTECVRVAQQNDMTVIVAGPTWRTVVYVPDDKQGVLDQVLAEQRAARQGGAQ